VSRNLLRGMVIHVVGLLELAGFKANVGKGQVLSLYIVCCFIFLSVEHW
jgi:hypothetical protein